MTRKEYLQLARIQVREAGRYTRSASPYVEGAETRTAYLEIALGCLCNALIFRESARSMGWIHYIRIQGTLKV